MTICAGIRAEALSDFVEFISEFAEISPLILFGFLMVFIIIFVLVFLRVNTLGAAVTLKSDQICCSRSSRMCKESGHTLLPGSFAEGAWGRRGRGKPFWRTLIYFLDIDKDLKDWTCNKCCTVPTFTRALVARVHNVRFRLALFEALHAPHATRATGACARDTGWPFGTECDQFLRKFY